MRESVKRLSCVVSEALDCLGYSQEQIVRRVCSTEITNQKLGLFFHKLLNANVEVCLAGSRGEGVPFKSDTDLVLIFRGAVCVEEGNVEDGLYVFQLEMSDTLPGYTKLSVRHTHFNFDLLSVLIHLSISEKIGGDNNVVYLSSLKYQNTLRRICSSEFPIDYITYPQKESNGPAISVTANLKFPFSNISLSMDMDMVVAFPAHVPGILNVWRIRRRFFDWPSTDLIDDVASSEAVCVPVSLTGSGDSDLQWRFCFPQGDKKLILSMNNSQIKLYVLLKVIFTDIVSKKDFGLTSYMIKNIVCWTCEGIASSHFTPEYLLDRLKNTLFFLKQCLEDNMLPCYLLPTRNLLIGKIEGFMRNEAIQKVSKLLSSNCSFLMQCNQLNKSMILTYIHPATANKAMAVRNLLEEFFRFIQQKISDNFQFHNEAILTMSYGVLSDPDILQLVIVLVNLIGEETFLGLDFGILDREKSSFLNMLCL